MLSRLWASALLCLLVGGCAQGALCEEGEGCDDPGGESLSCTPGEARCVGNAVQRCTLEGVYGASTPCLSGETCAEGVCQTPGQAGCGAPQCSLGEGRCDGEGLAECATDANGCLVWGAPRPCFGGAACEDGRCLDEACPAGCDYGDRRCLDVNTWAECVDKSGCPAWGPPQSCLQTETCGGGACQPAGQGCVDDCAVEGERICIDALRQQVCVNNQGCLRWSSAQACGAGQSCVAGEGCVSSCQEDCVPGEAICEGAGRRQCEAGPDGCLTYGAVEACPSGTVCDNGQCASDCGGSCVIGDRRCGVQGPETCIRSDPCPRWAPAQACPAGAQCVGAGECLAGDCTPGQVERGACDGACGTRSRTCDNSGQWGPWGACGGGGVCTPGQSQACGQCGTRRCTNACQWGACEGEGVCTPGETGACGQCGSRTCTNLCTWGACDNGDGTDWRRCNDCGWQFCCPSGDWCECAGNFPASCNGGQCTDEGVCR